MSRPQVVELGPCRSCGYDLRGLRPGGKCPECGSRIPSGTATLGGPEGQRADELMVALGWLAKASLWPLPIGLGCIGVTGWFGAPLLVATTGLSWLRLLGVRRVAAAVPEAGGIAVPAAIVECVLAATLAMLVFLSSFLPTPGSLTTAAYVSWIGAAAVSTILARRVALATARFAEGQVHPGVLDGVLAVMLAVGAAGMVAGRSVAIVPPGTLPATLVSVLAAVSLLGGLVASLAAFGLWRATRELADDLPNLPRFRSRRGPPIPTGLPPKPEPMPLEVASPRREAEREPIDLEPPTLPQPARESPAAPARTDPPPSSSSDGGDDDLWNGWKT